MIILDVSARLNCQFYRYLTSDIIIFSKISSNEIEISIHVIYLFPGFDSLQVYLFLCAWFPFCRDVVDTIQISFTFKIKFVHFEVHASYIHKTSHVRPHTLFENF